MVNRPYRSAMCPGCQVVAPPRGLGPGGHGQFGHHQQDEAGRCPCARGPQPGDPAALHHGDARRVPQGAPAPCGMPGGGPEPLGDHREAHQDVAGHHDREIAVLERLGHSGGQHQGARHLKQRQQPVGHVVGVVGGGEPGEVHPRPPDREEHGSVPGEPGLQMPFRPGVVEFGRGLGDRHHEGQVEQQLQGGGRTVLLAGIPAAHHPPQGSRPLPEVPACTHPASPARCSSAARGRPPQGTTTDPTGGAGPWPRDAPAVRIPYPGRPPPRAVETAGRSGNGARGRRYVSRGRRRRRERRRGAGRHG